jgi:drug/metabolite transporter (DMT)-like permease
MVGHFLLIKALELKRVSVLSPFRYTQPIWVTLFGYLIFGQWPDSHAFIGMAVIVGSGLYVPGDIAHGATKTRTRRSSESVKDEE